MRSSSLFKCPFHQGLSIPDGLFPFGQDAGNRQIIIVNHKISIIPRGDLSLDLLQPHVLGGIGGQETEGGFQRDLALFYQDPDDFMEGVRRSISETDTLHLFIETGLAPIGVAGKGKLQQQGILFQILADFVCDLFIGFF